MVEYAIVIIGGTAYVAIVAYNKGVADGIKQNINRCLATESFEQYKHKFMKEDQNEKNNNDDYNDNDDNLAA